MQLEELKSWFLRNKTQLIVFKRETGKYVDSCHTCLDVKSLLGKSVYKEFPLMESMQKVIQAMQPHDSPIEIPAVHDTTDGQDLYFDYYFLVHPQNAREILWFLEDLTAIYLKLREVQQERNELRFQLSHILQKKS